MKSISQFKDEFEFLSNFYPCTLNYKGHSWKTVEHAYQAEKTLNTCDKEKIRNTKYPGQAKKLGGLIKTSGNLRKDWRQVNVRLMTELVWLKFEQNPELCKRLMNTGSAKLCEGNYWHDNFYGDCYCKKCMDIPGKNMLGYILMKVREELNAELEN